MFDESIKFKYPWRDYQQQVLNKAQQYISDGHIHVVAAPGSGKTVLGLELARRINLPTIILAPTIAIRNQWAERFTTLFMDTEELPKWLSLDAKKPARLTIITYQGLYSALAGREVKDALEGHDEQSEEEDGGETVIEAPEDPEPTPDETLIVPSVSAIEPENDTALTVGAPGSVEVAPQLPANPKAAAYLEKLQKLGIRTIIVDEAHHLRNDWWRSLNDLQRGLVNPVVVALTATPPYDAEQAEWRKYQGFCGPIDVEVSVPELVARGDLCPHQDYVRLATLTEAESESARQVKDRMKAYVKGLKADQELITALAAHPVFIDATRREQLVFDNPEYFTAIGSFLLSAGQKQIARPLLKMISGRNFGLMPKFNGREAEALLSNMLYHDPYFLQDSNQALVERLRSEGSQAGVIEARQVAITNNKAIAAILRDSVSKLDSVQRIVTFELASFKDELRCVVLTDFIRQEYIPPYKGELRKIGVIPIFERLRQSVGQTGTDRLGILSGVIVVIPVAAKEQLISHLNDVAAELEVRKPRISFESYVSDERFVICRVNDQTRQFMVRAVTRLFEDGAIQILVGTKSLLGEGWDAPAINSLVLASVVGTFMLSNQMRGRAIRTDPNHPDKVANIWHIATVLPGAKQLDAMTLKTDDLGPEYDLLARRFETFVGVNARHDSIESGIERALYLQRGPYVVASLSNTIEAANNLTFASARDKLAVKERWAKALAGNEVGQLVHTTQIEHPKLPRGFIFNQTIKAVLIALAANWLLYLENLPQILARSSGENMGGALLLVGVITFLFTCVTVFQLVRYLYVAIRHYSPEKSMDQVADALLAAMCGAGIIKTPRAGLHVVTSKSITGEISCGLKGGATYENDVFLDCLEELLAPIANPRYLLQSRGSYRFIGIIRAGFNTYAVPTPLGLQKKNVVNLLGEWQHRVGPCRAIYTRTLEGRRILLKARRESLSGGVELAQLETQRLDISLFLE